MDQFIPRDISTLFIALPSLLSLAVVLFGLARQQRVKARKPPRKDISNPGDCPYEYLLGVYGRHHFAGFVKKLSPSLESRNLEKWNMVLEIMDGIHFCLILVDDVRKQYPASIPLPLRLS